MMFFWISVVPPSIEFARERRNVYCHEPPSSDQSEPPMSCEYGPSISIASSCSFWCVSTQPILPADASGPGISPLSSLVMARAPVYLSDSVSIQSCASFWRITGSFVTTRPLFSTLRAISMRLSSVMRSRTCSPKPSASRSYISVVSPTCQPPLTSPSTCDSCTRTLSKNTSLNSGSPVICTSGRTVTPTSCMSAIR